MKASELREKALRYWIEVGGPMSSIDQCLATGFEAGYRRALEDVQKFNMAKIDDIDGWANEVLTEFLTIEEEK